MSRFFREKLTREEFAKKIMEYLKYLVKKSKEEYGDDDFAEQPDIWNLPPLEAIERKYRYSDNYYYILNSFINDKNINKDLSKVVFDTENIEGNPNEAYAGANSICGIKTFSNGLTYLGATAGGDWEQPLFFIIYHDGNNFRAYIPKDGNTWNTDTNMAYGNSEEDEDDPDNADIKNINKRFGKNYKGWEDVGDINVDCDKIIKDIENRIIFKP
ncbi:MAG: hypothetical protein AABY32_02640 [Nanoarchaeota archaeon]